MHSEEPVYSDLVLYARLQDTIDSTDSDKYKHSGVVVDNRKQKAPAIVWLKSEGGYSPGALALFGTPGADPTQRSLEMTSSKNLLPDNPLSYNSSFSITPTTSTSIKTSNFIHLTRGPLSSGPITLLDASKQEVL